MAVTAANKRAVRHRAAGFCEYCRMRESWEAFFTYHIEHIMALQHGGTDDLSNLALSCYHCNLHKGTNLVSLDPDTGKMTQLFHPRLLAWEQHFRMEGSRMIGLTAIGRTTAFLLQMNATHRMELRHENSDLW